MVGYSGQRMQTSEDAGWLGGIYRWTAHFPAVNTKDWWYWVHRRSSQLGKGLPSRGLTGAYLPLPWILWPGAPPPESAAPSPASLTGGFPRAGAEAAHPWPLFKIRKCHFSSGYVSFVFSLSKQFRVIIFAFNLKPLSGVCVCVLSITDFECTNMTNESLYWPTSSLSIEC